MIGALWTGISGLSSQQKALDNESNNIANVNTIGYKASRISFADQMYQDRIGKGSKILDAEKLYTQGSLKLTGVNYDMALSGDGFFTVLNTRSSGSAETLYTRAGNFRMGDNGTLQDSAGNEVQGWPMMTLDTENDVTSTNPNVKVFNTDYSKLLGSKVIRHSDYVDTITAKATDYSLTAKSDSSKIYSGAGMKTKAAKIADIEAAITDYTTWLQKLKDEPDGLSATSISQISQINYKTGSDGIISKDGDQIYVYINGSKISQNYIVTTATAADIKALDEGVDANGEAYPDTTTGGSGTGGAWTPADYDRAVSRIATYKALADKISSVPGLIATMSSESGGNDNDVLESSGDLFTLSTKMQDMYKGIIQIKSLIPGKSFTVSEVAEVSGITTSQGSYLTTTPASAGSGIGALESSKNALSKLISGKQEDVYTPTNLDFPNSSIFNYSINIYDKELGTSIPVPNDGKTIPAAIPLTLTATTVDEFVSQFNTLGNTTSPKLTDYVKAENINGNVVIKTLDKNYDVEFSSVLKELPAVKFDIANVIDNTKYAFKIGAITTLTIDAAAKNTYTAEQLYNDVVSKLKVYNDTVDATKKLSISPNSDYSSFSIYTANDAISFVGSTATVNDDVALPITSTLNVKPILVSGVVPSTIMGKQDIALTGAAPFAGDYKVTIDLDGAATKDTPITITSSQTSRGSTSSTNDQVIQDLVNQINSNTNLKDYVKASLTSTGKLEIERIKFKDFDSIANGIQSTELVDFTLKDGGGANFGTATIPGIAADNTFFKGQAVVYEQDLNSYLADNKSASIITVDINGTKLQIQTDQNPTIDEVAGLLQTELAKNSTLSSQIQISFTGTKLEITGKLTDKGYIDFGNYSAGTSKINITSAPITDPVVPYVSKYQTLDKSSDYSGREGAGAEFIEIKNKVDQTASKGSLQLRLDTLGLSDTAFGEFSVDSTGLVTMKQDGAEFAIGQVAIALFNNNQGLDPVGDNLLAKSNDSGEPIYNLNNNKTAKIEGKTLELSKADLSESLVNLMVFQRAFEANAKSITTSDELLNTLINLKR